MSWQCGAFTGATGPKWLHVSLTWHSKTLSSNQSCGFVPPTPAGRKARIRVKFNAHGRRGQAMLDSALEHPRRPVGFPEDDALSRIFPSDLPAEPSNRGDLPTSFSPDSKDRL